MIKSVVVTGALMCLASFASFARAQEPICIIDGVRRPPTDCTAVGADRVKSIDVLKGQAAALHGPDAAGGVISIVTKGGAGEGRPPGDDPFARHLFPPELVMAHQQAIGLTDRQRSALQDAMKDAQGKFIDLQFRMSAEVEKLQRLIEGTTVDEGKVLEQVDRVLTLERQVKHVQLTLMIRVKNQLTPQQQQALARLRK